MANRLSYSQVRLYQECGKKYEYTYIQKYREKVKSGALFFGTSFDKAVEAVLEDPSIDETEVFDKWWTNQDLNGKMTYLPESIAVVYSATDFDADLLTEDDIKFLTAKCTEMKLEGTVLEAYTACATAKKQKAFRHFKETENKFLNLCNWVSLRRKGHLMLVANRKVVMPKIKKLLGTQIKVELKNDDGDTLLGYADMHCIWEDGREVVFDYKTSASDYPEDSVLTKPQLPIYCHAMDVAHGGYLVFKKQIRKNRIKVCESCGFNGSGGRHKTCSAEVEGKRCGGAWKETISPEADVQILIDKIPERTEEIVLENIAEVNKAIKGGIFVRNFNSCEPGYGSCAFKNLCFKNDDSDLEKR